MSMDTFSNAVKAGEVMSILPWVKASLMPSLFDLEVLQRTDITPMQMYSALQIVYSLKEQVDFIVKNHKGSGSVTYGGVVAEIRVPPMPDRGNFHYYAGPYHSLPPQRNNAFFYGIEV